MLAKLLQKYGLNNHLISMPYINMTIVNRKKKGVDGNVYHDALNLLPVQSSQFEGKQHTEVARKF